MLDIAMWIKLNLHNLFTRHELEMDWIIVMQTQLPLVLHKLMVLIKW